MNNTVSRRPTALARALATCSHIGHYIAGEKIMPHSIFLFCLLSGIQSSPPESLNQEDFEQSVYWQKTVAVAMLDVVLFYAS